MCLKLYELHKGFLKKVDKEMKKESPELSPLLLELSSSMLDVYAIYVRGNNHAVDLLTSKMRSKKIRQLIQDGTKVKKREGGKNFFFFRFFFF